MSHTIPQCFTYAELDKLAAEALPQRLLMSSAGAHGGHGGGHGAHHSDTTVFYACQSTYSSGTSGVLGTGLLAEPARSSLTCVPGVVAHKSS